MNTTSKAIMDSSVHECMICSEEFDVADRKPTCLQCGHTFCRLCLMHIEATSGRNCPECRQLIVQPLDQLPVVYALIPQQPNTPAPKTNHSLQIPRCQIHPCNLDYFCVDCGDILCRKCFRQSHQQHRVEFIYDILNKDEIASNFTKELQKKVKAKVNSITNTLSVLRRISKHVNMMKVCKEEMQQYEDVLLATKASAAEDLSAWSNTEPKSAEDEHELFKRLCKAWKEKNLLLPDEETTGFTRKLDELMAYSRQVQGMVVHIKMSMQKHTPPPMAAVGLQTSKIEDKNDPRRCLKRKHIFVD